MKQVLPILFVLIFANAISAFGLAITVPYTGSFDEATVVAEGGLPAGDYDTIGGPPDVGLFNLLDGVNTFEGSVWTPGDSADVFLIGVGAGQTLTGASIAFGTNLSLSQYMFAFPAPQWTLEESDADPTIFNIPAVGWDYMSSTLFLDAPSFSRGEGIYNVLLGNGTFGINAGNYDTPIDYTMAFTVESEPIPEPTTIFLLGTGIVGLVGTRLRRKKK